MDKEKKKKQTTYFLITPSQKTLGIIEAVKMHLRVLRFQALPEHRRKTYLRRESLPMATNSEAVEFICSQGVRLWPDMPALLTRQDVYPEEAVNTCPLPGRCGKRFCTG